MLKTEEEFIEKLNQKFPNNNIEIISYTAAFKPLTYRCSQCGKIHTVSRANRLYDRKYLCGCENKRESKLRDNLYSFLQSQQQFILLDDWNKTSDKAHFLCQKCGHDFYKKIIKDSFDVKSFCPICGKNGCVVSQEVYEKRMEDAGKTDYQIVEYKKYTQSMKLKHLSCGRIFSVLPFNFLKGRGCPYCYKKISKGEQKIINWLENNKINYDFQKKFESLGTKTFDFYLPSYNMLIEYNGEQHYTPQTHFGGEEKFKLQKENDSIKQKFAFENNFSYLEIGYFDFNEIEHILSFATGSTTRILSVSSSELKERLPYGNDIV